MTKIVLKSLLATLVISLLFTGCSNKELIKPIDVRGTYIDPELEGAPEWVKTPFVEGYISELGSASKNAGNDVSFQRDEAMADARDHLATQISIKVNNMFKAYKTITGSGKDATFDNSSEKVSKQIASQSLSGTRVKDTWISRSGTLYVLMVIDTEYVSNILEKEVKTSFKNDKALYQRFLSSRAQGELDQELSKLNK